MASYRIGSLSYGAMTITDCRNVFMIQKTMGINIHNKLVHLIVAFTTKTNYMAHQRNGNSDGSLRAFLPQGALANPKN